MTFREQCALAAMREILSVDLPEGRVDAPGDVAKAAKDYADAMVSALADDADQAEAPKMPDIDATMCREISDAELERARREGRDAGLAEAIQVVARRRFHSDFQRDGRTLQDAWEAISEQLDKAPAPDGLASENAKLRAVAEAAARLQRLRDSNRPDGIGEASLQLDGALGNWLPGWRTK